LNNLFIIPKNIIIDKQPQKQGNILNIKSRWAKLSLLLYSKFSKNFEIIINIGGDD
jgi:hypothetical protein